MAYVTCHCNHGNDVHNLGLDCTLCDCILYRPSTAPDPLANDHRANANKLLSFSRESTSAKVRRLGVKIEGLLDNLAEAAEEEIAAKIQQERLEQERTKAIDAANKARKALKEAEARLGELDIKIDKPKVRKTPVQKPENLVLIPCEYPGCGRKIQKRSMGVHKYNAHGIRKEAQ